MYCARCRIAQDALLQEIEREQKSVGEGEQKACFVRDLEPLFSAKTVGTVLVAVMKCRSRGGSWRAVRP